MTCIRQTSPEAGFTLIELLAALGIFLLITGAAFSLLTSSQQRYQTDSQLLTSFQEARLGLDQMVRDINDAGYPPPSFVSTDVTTFTRSPFGWSPGYTVPTPCTVDITCNPPGDFDLIIETNPNPQDGGPVQWIRYQLGGPNGTTLLRGMAPKQWGHDPAIDTATNLGTFVENVVNNSPNLQIGQFQLSATSAGAVVFPSGNPVPIFQYTCDTPITAQPPPTLCSAAGADNSPANIRDVAITLIVASPLPDATTGQPRLVKLTARGRRVNPNQ
ncbi:MAG TPA: prepilin-type N-terminal cleavage/methylation domain-containing protein [Methylomirabilota bacterium]|nr:prepilin-type N-terminal cleavage/methylation domain-containing protein [Methylomirabilota bacterium]